MLSDKIGVPLSDTDRIIEREVGKKVYQIFDDCGERYFRKVEEEVLIEKAGGVDGLAASLLGRNPSVEEKAAIERSGEPPLTRGRGALLRGWL